MGQRGFIMVKRNFKGNKSTIDLIHHQWCLGKTLGALFLGQLLELAYSCDRNKSVKEGYIPTSDEFKFEPLSNKKNNYIYNLSVKTTDKKYDVWNSKARMELCSICDNNNGGMVIEITQKYRKDGSPITYGDCMDIKVGFCLGNEETDYSHEKLRGYIAIEQPFERIVSIAEFMDRTWEKGIFEGSNKMFLNSFNNLCKLFGVEQVVEKGKSKFDKKLLKLQALAETYTRDVAKGQEIEIPKDLREQILVFN